MRADNDATNSTFDWRDTLDELRATLRKAKLSRDGMEFHGDGTPAETGDPAKVTFTPPLVLTPILSASSDPADNRPDAFLRALEAGPGLGHQALLLLRAGSAALGLWHDDTLIAHKVFKRYVVRGNGRAQSTHLATKGKSRYGSRLRLQNAKRLLEETRERLDAWHDDSGIDALFVACPVRLWHDFEAIGTPPSYGGQAPIRIPFHVHEPGHKELLRVRRISRRGRVSWITTP